MILSAFSASTGIFPKVQPETQLQTVFSTNFDRKTNFNRLFPKFNRPFPTSTGLSTNFFYISVLKLFKLFSIMMTMDRLFISLPRDLQWEILSEFVGTHVVRNGRLRRKLTVHITHYQYMYSLRDRPWYDWLYYEDTDDMGRFYIEYTRIWLKRVKGKNMLVCRDRDRDETAIYMYLIPGGDPSSLELGWKSQYTPDRLEDSIVLTPFKKNTYLSYPFTNKKRGIHPP